MNTYAKYCPNVFVAKCEEQHAKGDIIPVTTRHGKENDSIVFNLVAEREGAFYYSIIRADGMNMQEYAKKKAEKFESWSDSAQNKSNEFYKKSNKDSDFLSLAEPIKVGHHSEKRHRKVIEQAQDNATKSYEFRNKAEEHDRKVEYWKSRENDINLSMPESIDFYEVQLQEAKEYHAGLKSGEIKKSHSYSMVYANKAVKDLTKKYELSQKLWS
jgi:hypothetical protein